MANIYEKIIASFATYGKDFALNEREVVELCQRTRQVLLQDEMLIKIDASVRIFVVGDLHGQFDDLLKIFEITKVPSNATRFLFLGDYVDRGKYSLETICTLFYFKTQFPKNVFLLRGNHESATVCIRYGFFDECKRRSTLKAWRSFVDCFNVMPVSALIGNKILCMHGGISPELTDLKQIAMLERPTEIPDYGLLCDLLWADPDDTNADHWNPNDRGLSFTFSEKILQTFLTNLDLLLICRAHECVVDGYLLNAKKTIVTVFSASNYGGNGYKSAFIVMTPDDATGNIDCQPLSIFGPTTGSTGTRSGKY